MGRCSHRLNLTPGLGDAKGFIEVFTGCDLVTGENLGHWRWAGLLFLSELRTLRYADDAALGATSINEFVTGARKYQYGQKLDDHTRWEKYAPEAYEYIRQADDIAEISRNTGIPEYRVRRIKSHLFEWEHQLDDRFGRFDADPDIADAWERLRRGDYTHEDLRLLDHEYFESKFERIFKTDYRTAHDATLRSGRTWNP